MLMLCMITCMNITIMFNKVVLKQKEKFMEELKEKIAKLYERIDYGVDCLHKSQGEQEELNSQIKTINESLGSIKKLTIDTICEVETLRDVKETLRDVKVTLDVIETYNSSIIMPGVIGIERSSIVSLEQTAISQLLQIKQMHATGSLTDEEAFLSSKNCMQILIERLNKYKADLKPRQETIDMYKRFVKIYKGTLTKTEEAGLNQ